MDKLANEKLMRICISLKEFSYCLDTLDIVSLSCDQGCAEMRFYLNSLYSYTANYFLLDNGTNNPIGGNLYPVLKELGLEDRLNEVIEILHNKIESMELKEILRKFRNKVIVHTDYSFDSLDEHIYKIVDLTTMENFHKYQELIQKLFDKTKQLYVNLGSILLENNPDMDQI